MRNFVLLIFVLFFTSCKSNENKPQLVYEIQINKDVLQLGMQYSPETTFDTVMAIDAISALRNLFKKAIALDMTAKQLESKEHGGPSLNYYSGKDTSGVSLKDVLSEKEIDSIRLTLHGMMTEEIFNKFKN